ncbi:MAG: hypothetical protein ABII72_00145 [Parcubacteria group bacterium]
MSKSPPGESDPGLEVENGVNLLDFSKVAPQERAIFKEQRGLLDAYDSFFTASKTENPQELLATKKGQQGQKDQDVLMRSYGDLIKFDERCHCGEIIQTARKHGFISPEMSCYTLTYLRGLLDGPARKKITGGIDEKRNFFEQLRGKAVSEPNMDKELAKLHTDAVAFREIEYKRGIDLSAHDVEEAVKDLLSEEERAAVKSFHDSQRDITIKMESEAPCSAFLHFQRDLQWMWGPAMRERSEIEAGNHPRGEMFSLNNLRNDSGGGRLGDVDETSSQWHTTSGDNNYPY